jgi:hypothetical protein
MSTVAFGALATRRELSTSGTSTSTEPPGLNSYVDVLAALVPAEVLTIQVLVVAATATQTRHSAVFTEPATYRWMFWILLAVAPVLFVLGRKPTPTTAAERAQAGGAAPLWRNLEWQDLIRALVPMGAFTCWTIAASSGVWNAVWSGMSSGMRLLIPMVGAVVLAAVTKALASHSDSKPSPAQKRAQPASPPGASPPVAPDSEPPSQPDPSQPGPPRPVLVPETTPETTPEPDTALAGPVPRWVY